jgi:hypothetical protein
MVKIGQAVQKIWQGEERYSHASTRITNHYAYTIEMQILGKAEETKNVLQL